MQRRRAFTLSKARKRFTYIDLFAGCGGLSLGLYNAGWKGLFAIEKSPLAFKTLEHNLILKKNHFQWPTWLSKRSYDIKYILKQHKENLVTMRGKVDMVAGGPPCQGFSTAGKREEGDLRNNLIKSYVSFIKLVQPKILFFENVKGFTQEFRKNKTKGIKYSEYVIKRLSTPKKDFAGYDVLGKLIDFSEYGIPQKRTRFILIGVRKDLSINNQEKLLSFFTAIKTDVEKFLISKELPLKPTLEDAISDLLSSAGKKPSPDSKGFEAGIYAEYKTKYQKFLRGENTITGNIADSHRFTKHSIEIIKLFKLLHEKAVKGEKIQGEDKKKYDLKKRGITVLKPDEPSPTLTSHPDDFVHYKEHRILTPREYARIQSFPDWYEIRAKYTTGGKLRKKEVPRYTQLGNAIPPLFGELAGKALREILK